MARTKRDGLYRRGRTWWARTDPATNGRKSTGCTDLTAARAWLAQRQRLAADPAHAAASQATLGGWIRRTLEDKRLHRSAGTLDVYQDKLGHWGRILGVDCRLSEITPATCDRYAEQRRSEETAVLTIYKEFSALSQLLKSAKRAGCFPGDLAALRPMWVVQHVVPRKRALTAPEVSALLAACHPRLRALVSRLVGLGLRLGEACRMRPEDLDADSWVVSVRGTKTAGSRRVIPVLAPFREMVVASLEAGDFGRYLNVTRDLAKACKRAKIDRCTPNDLRRTQATLLHEAGVDPDVIRRLLGHSTTAMVNRVYAQPRPQALASLAEPHLAGLLGPFLYKNVTLGDGGCENRANFESRTRDLRFTKPVALVARSAGETDKSADALGAGSHGETPARMGLRTETSHSPSAWSLAYAYARVAGRAA